MKGKMRFLNDLRQKVQSWFEVGEEEKAMEGRESGNRVIRSRYKRAAERLMENSSLRDELDDEQAKRVLDWGNEQLKKVADETADLPDNDAGNMLEAQTEQVSGVIRQVNQLTRAINNKDQKQLSDHYAALTQKLAELKETTGYIPANIAEWLALSEADSNWLSSQLIEGNDGEEE